MQPIELTLGISIALFIGATGVISVCGMFLTGVAERLARATGLGQAILGAVFLGAVTSLSGAVTSVTAALAGYAEIAVGNAVGGIAAQTTFLVIADMVYRKTNLEHAAASEVNLMQGVLLIALLALPLLGMSGLGVTYGSVDATSVAILFTYFFGLRLISQSHRMPMWWPRQSGKAQSREPSRPQPGDRQRLGQLWLAFGVFAALVALSGWMLANAGIAIAQKTGLSETIVGTLFTSVATSMPELVVAIAAVRRGALNMAVGDIMGGNSFDVLFLVLADFCYRPGSIYEAVSRTQMFWLSLTILMTSVLLMGLLRREKHGFGNIGFEGVLVLGMYLLAVSALILRVS
jgi:cation:H+ antiporter